MDPSDKRPDNSLDDSLDGASADNASLDSESRDAARAAGSADSSDAASVDEPGRESGDASSLLSEGEIDADLTDSSSLSDDAESSSEEMATDGAAGTERSILPVPVDPQSRLPETGEGRAQATALSAYMSELRHHAPITREEEHELAVRWTEDGDVEAAKLLVVSNLRLVVKIAMEYRRAWTNTLDLIQEGNVGLMGAVQRFDPYKGVKLSSYAVYWVRAYILKYILDNMRSVRLGTTRASRKLFFRLNKEKRELERLGYDVEPKLLAERLDVTEDDVIDMEARLSRPDLSFDAPLRSDEGDGMTFGDRMAAPGISSEAMVGSSELREVFLGRVEAFAESLGERDLIILRSRILADEPRTLAELGEEFDVSRERVRQLEVKIVDRLRAYMKENLVDFKFYEPGG